MTKIDLLKVLELKILGEHTITSFTFIAHSYNADLKYILSQDGLLSQGNHDLIMRIYNKIPKLSSDGKRLQVRYTLPSLIIYIRRNY